MVVRTRAITAQIVAAALLPLALACGDDPPVETPPADAGLSDGGGTDVDSGVGEQPDGSILDGTIGDANPIDATPADIGPVPPGLPGVVTDFAKSIEFLYPSQIGLTPGVIRPAEVAVLRGQVVDVDGAPLPAVTVTLLGHGELGRTETDANGEFNFVLNGGPIETLDFQKAGYLPVQRALSSKWLRFSILPDPVVMIVPDPVGTMVAFGTASMQTHQASMEADAVGMRRATVAVPPNVSATMVMPGGARVPLAMGMIRATEYTVGERGPQAMPGQLPPQSAYTYAVELSVDEALAAGAETVEFSAPVITYVDNFRGAPAGEAVPLGYYDRQRGLWVAEPDGVVVEILGVTAGLADLDTDGDGQADDATQLAVHGIDDTERATIAGLYPSGGSVWRVRIGHFSPWDCNFGPWVPDPNSDPPRNPDNGDPSPCPQSGSIIGCEDQSLGEVIPILGTSFELRYQSRAARGRAVESRAVLKVSGSDIQSLALLQRIRVTGEIAGRKVQQVLTPGLDLEFTFDWDGLDAFGRPVIGPTPFEGVIEYQYSVFYGTRGAGQPGYSFGTGSGGLSPATDSQGAFYNKSTPFKKILTRFVRPAEAELGGWSIDAHHVYSPMNGMVSTGRGEVVGPADNLTVIAGNESSFEPSPGPALDTALPKPDKILVGPDGIVYILDKTFGQLWQVSTSGELSMAAGCLRGTTCPQLADGTPASTVSRTSATVKDFAIGPDNRLFVYFGDYSGFGSSLWRREDDGTLYRIGGMQGANPADVVVPPAESSIARDLVFDIGSIAAGPNQSVYFVNRQNTQKTQIMRIDADGRLARIVGSQVVPCAPIDNYLEAPATDACLLAQLTQLSVHSDGSVYFVSDARVYRSDPNGTLHHHAGAPQGCILNGALSDPPLADVCLQAAMVAFQVAPDGALHAIFNRFIDGENKVVLYRFEDHLVPVAGGGQESEGGFPTTFKIRVGSGLGFGFKPNGDLVLASFVPGTQAGKLFSTTSALGSLSATDTIVPDKNGRVAWTFDLEGRHLSTRDLLTGTALYTFAYDAEGRLETITDTFGGVTRIARTVSGATITGANGMVTTLEIDGSDRLTRVIAPSTSEQRITYHGTSELVATLTDERGRVSSYDYDADGRLVHESTPDGGDVTLVRRPLPNGAEVDFVADTQTTTYRSVVDDEGIRERAVFAPGRGVEAIRRYPDGRREILTADGTVMNALDGADPRFGAIMPYTRSAEIIKNGRTLTIDLLRTKSGGRGYFAEGSLLITGAIDGAESTMELDASMAQMRITSPAGRVRAYSYDAAGRLVRIEAGPGVAAKEAVYDAQGNLELVSFGAWAQAFEYGPDGLASAITSDGTTWSLARDADGLLTSITDPSGSHLVTHHDDGNLATLALPGGMTHLFESDGAGRPTGYTPPNNPAYTRNYNVGGVLESVGMPSGRTQVFEFGADGRLGSITYPEATVSYAYAGPADLPTTITRTPGAGAAHTTTLEYEANLPVRTTYSGATSGQEDLTYGPSFLLMNRSFTSGADSVSYPLTYDADRRLMSYGPMNFTRNGPDRMVDTVTVGNGSITLTYSPEGKLASRSLSVGGTAKHTSSYTFGNFRLPVTRVDDVEGNVRNETFAYDQVGQLISVERNGTMTETYAYDARGNRTSAGGESATYDAQDRLIDRGGNSYSFGPDGFLESRSTASYSYSTTGELLSATVGGVTVTYEYDGFRRLVRRTQGGQSTRFYYGDPLDVFRLSAYQAPGEGLTHCFHDEWGFLVALERGGARWIVGSDLVGSPRVVVDDASGAVVKTIDRDAYGVILSDSAPSFVLPIGYAGGLEDPQTQLVRFGMRDYEPAAGRFTARDPALLDGHQTNFYAYARSSPLGYRDPSGLFCIGGSAFGGIGGGGKFCITKEKISVCGELGFGAGVAADVQPWANVDGNTVSMEAALKAGVGPLGTGCEASYGVNLDKIGGADPCRFMVDGDCKSSAFGADFSMIKGQEGDGVGPVDIANLVQKDAVNTRSLKAKGIELQTKVSAKACGQASW
ncbi:MAG: hypothetical protein IPG45_30075 [Deltaproteobacteria bacterium]|nr:hypothetical protein [Deltaproteobacteria bacterium]